MAAVVVLGLVALSLVSGNRGGSASPEVSASQSSQNYFEGAPAVTSPNTPVADTTATTGVTSTNPGQSATTTAPKTTTTAAPPSECGADKKAGFGCPVLVDDFNGSTFAAGSQGWAVYNYPDASFPRIASNATVANGEAQLAGTYDKSTGTILGSGISSQISQKYGRWEVRMAVEAGRGWSAAGLLWPTSERWPTDGEIDLFEIPHAQRQDIFQTIHNGVRNNTGENKVNIDATKFHTYAIEWTPMKLTYFIDNQAKWTVTKPALVPTTGDLHLTLQMDPGTQKQCGAWFECPNASTPASATMHIDSAKIWLYQG